jgi:hypothetical protein
MFIDGLTVSFPRQYEGKEIIEPSLYMSCMMLLQTIASSSKKLLFLELIISSALRQIILWYILTCATTHYVFMACLMLVCTNGVTQRYSVAVNFVPNESSTMMPVKHKPSVSFGLSFCGCNVFVDVKWSFIIEKIFLFISLCHETR